jgi:demethylmenaquinone methyltransferase / 2-methoxy-6-polyprenyl-1,4-benzoquinol methylase
MSHLGGEARARYVEAMFARIVPRYDLMNSLMTFGQDRRWRELTVDGVCLRPGGRALDVATGTGELALALARRGASEVVGLDFTPGMLVAAREKAAALGIDTVRFVAGDALALPFEADAFDAATVGFGLRNVADLPRALSEMRRCLRPGGRMACLELTHSPVVPFALASRPFFYGVVPLLGGIIAGNREAYTYLPESVERFPNARRLAAMTRAAGFREAGYRLLNFGTVAIHVGVK